ncbi:MAG: hypothetical protein K9N23_15850 [Akkermansiaceae bacterium]|nr:hypothetical protein [Akkermansiaceae bacterium]
MTLPTRTPWWLWPNLLSLDAPLVAVVWLFMLAKTWGVNYHPEHEYAVLALVVWAIYVVDRLLDGMIHGDSTRCQERHQFHLRHRRKLAPLAVVAVVAAMTLVLNYTPMAIYGYAAVAGFLISGFFAMALFATPDVGEIPYSKNVLGGLSFAFGTSMVAHVYLFDKGIVDLLLHSREFIAFAVLCIMNISAIDLWEHASRTEDEELKAQDELALTLPLVLLGGAAFLFARQADGTGAGPFFYAVLTGAALLFVLNRSRARFSLEALRVLADVAMVLPVLVFLGLR